MPIHAPRRCILGLCRGDAPLAHGLVAAYMSRGEPPLYQDAHAQENDAYSNN